MKAAIGIFVAFLLVGFFLLNSKKEQASLTPSSLVASDQHAPVQAGVNNQTTIQWLDSVKTVGKIKKR